MTAGEMPEHEAGLQAVEAYLDSDRSPDGAMGMSDLDGFLTAVAIGPELILPSEWLPVIWNGEAPEFADQSEAQAVVGGIMGRYNAILRQVGDGTIDPIFWVTDDAEEIVIASDWAEGFMQGIGLRADAWGRLLQTERGAELLFPILALCGDEEGESLLQLSPDEEDRMMEAAPELLPPAILAIAEFWRRRKPGSTAAPAQAAKPGRNDPCPCGSGRKYKKCCGASV